MALLADLLLTDQINLTGNLGFWAWAAEAENQISVILTPAVALPTEAALGVYGGYAGFFADSGDTHFAEAGVTWLPSPEVQLDLNGGVEPDSGDYFIGVGIAIRWGGD